MLLKSLIAAVAAAALAASPVWAQGRAGSATGGSGGSAAAGGTSATTLGSGGTSTGASGTGSSLASGGSAAGGKASSRTKVNENPNMLQGQSKAMAHEGGTFSKSKTKTKVRNGESVDSRTKSMSHVPGQKPVKSTSEGEAEIPQ